MDRSFVHNQQNIVDEAFIDSEYSSEYFVLSPMSPLHQGFSTFNNQKCCRCLTLFDGFKLSVLSEILMILYVQFIWFLRQQPVQYLEITLLVFCFLSFVTGTAGIIRRDIRYFRMSALFSIIATTLWIVCGIFTAYHLIAIDPPRRLWIGVVDLGPNTFFAVLRIYGLFRTFKLIRITESLIEYDLPLYLAFT